MKIQILLSVISAMVMTSASQAAIFGDDDRVYVNAKSPQARLGQAVAVGVLNTIHPVNEKGLIDLWTDTIDRGLCSEEKFAKDPSISYACSAFLVAPNLLVTAGHCASNGGVVENEPEGYCDVYDWLFDYQANEAGKTQITDIDPAKLYSCKRIIYAVQNGEHQEDFALIELDRKVEGREPLKLAELPQAVGDTLTMIGFPLGTAMKLSTNASVLRNDLAQPVFATNLDALDGNSGSPVFNDRNEVVGLLVSGSPRSILHEVPGRQCSIYNRCDQDGSKCLTEIDDEKGPFFSEVQRIQPLLSFIQRYGRY